MHEPDELISPSATTDVACIQCGYNLRGLSPDGVCPECACTIERSLRGPWLRYADARWLRRLRVGTLLLLIHAILWIVTAATAMVAVWLLSTYWGWLRYTFLPLLCLFIAGLLAITAKEPIFALTNEPSALRKILRGAALLLPVVYLVDWAGEYFVTAATADATASSVLSALWIVANCGALALLGRLASRIPSRSLAKATTAAIWAYAVAGGLSIVVSCYLTLRLASSSGTLLPSAVYPISNCLYFGRAAINVWIAVLLFLYYRGLKAELAKARRFTAEGPEARQAHTGGFE